METREVQTACPRGAWCSVGVTIPCPKDTYQPDLNKLDQGACMPCPDHAEAPEGSIALADCQCKPGYYSKPSAAAGQGDARTRWLYTA